VATREYFPRKVRAAVRQRTRWITGISLQSWARNGWRGGLRQNYWFWRDRKGLLTNPVSLVANILFGYGMLTWIGARFTSHGWGLGRYSLHPALFVIILVLQLLHMGIRMVSVARYFGWRFSCGVPLRMLVANGINCTATIRAEYRFLRALVLHEPLLWLKTDHAYPSQAALQPHRRRLGEILTACGYVTQAQLDEALATQPAGVRLGEHLVALGHLAADELYEALGLQQGLPAGPVTVPHVSARVARSLPRAVMKEWKVVPVGISDGCMMLASPEIPDEEMTGVLGSLTTLKIQFHLVTPVNFAELRNAFL